MLPPIHLACSNNELQPAMTYVKIENGWATATDAHIAVQMELKSFSELRSEDIDRLNGKFIHKDIWKILMDAHFLTVSEFDSNLITYVKNGVRAVYDISCDVKFPNLKGVLKTALDKGYEPRQIFGIAPKYIPVIQKIFACSQLFFRSYKGGPMPGYGPFVIFAPEIENAYALLMAVEPRKDNAKLNFQI